MLFADKEPSDNEEWFPIVDEEGNTIGKAPRSICHDGKTKFLHPVVHLHLLNTSGDIYLQKRALSKDIEPGKWDTSVGGHVDPGETIETALHRETEEELGLQNLKPVFILKYIWESARERELVHSFYAISDKCPVVNRNEIEEGAFWNIREIEDKTGKGVFTPNFEHEFKMIRTTLKGEKKGF